MRGLAPTRSALAVVLLRRGASGSVAWRRWQAGFAVGVGALRLQFRNLGDGGVNHGLAGVDVVGG